MEKIYIEEMLRALRPVLKNKAKARQILEKYWSAKCMAIVWTVEQVHRAANEKELALTENEAVKVLRHLFTNHNNQEGLKWQDITDYIEDQVLGRAMSKREIHQFVHNDIITINQTKTTKRKDK